MRTLLRRSLRLLVSLIGVAAVTFVAYRVIPFNATTVGFAPSASRARYCEHLGLP
jgi:ABC-type dipeptide/oligopeptide/nickel transport system permease component